MRFGRRVLKAETGVEMLAAAFDVSEQTIVEILEQELVMYSGYDAASEQRKIIEELKSTFELL